MDKELEKDYARDEIIQMKKSNPPNKPPLFKILGEAIGGSNANGEGNENAVVDAVGCTANVIMIDDNRRLIVANAGDSRCVLARNRTAVELSQDHKPENEIERTRIEASGSSILEGRVDGNLNLSRSLGDLKYKQKKGFTP